jgi:hypothetical protein
MRRARDRLNTNLKLCVLGVLCAIGVFSQFTSGSGVHRRVDATAGARGAAVDVADQVRYGELSDLQLANFDWALRQLPGDELQRRYGDHPTIRNVVLGEIMRAADAQLSIAKVALAKLATMDPVAVKASDERYKFDLNERKRTLNALSERSPIVTNISPEPPPLNDFLLVRYTIKLQDGVAIKFLPCTLDFVDRIPSKSRRLEFDCLSMAMKDGEYSVRVPARNRSEIIDSKPAIFADYSRAIVEVQRNVFELIDEVKPEIPETRIVTQAYTTMKAILDNKAYF